MKKTMVTLALSMAGLLAWTPNAQAAEVVVKMLNTGKEGPMAFEPAYVKVAVGDTSSAIKFLVVGG